MDDKELDDLGQIDGFMKVIDGALYLVTDEGVELLHKKKDDQSRSE